MLFGIGYMAHLFFCLKEVFFPRNPDLLFLTLRVPVVQLVCSFII